MIEHNEINDFTTEKASKKALTFEERQLVLYALGTSYFDGIRRLKKKGTPVEKAVTIAAALTTLEIEQGNGPWRQIVEGEKYNPLHEINGTIPVRVYGPKPLSCNEPAILEGCPTLHEVSSQPVELVVNEHQFMAASGL